MFAILTTVSLAPHSPQIAWSLFEPQVIATSSIDTNVNIWDTRDPSKPLKLRSLFAHGAPHIHTHTQRNAHWS